jgi:hypothetical protein
MPNITNLLINNDRKINKVLKIKVFDPLIGEIKKHLPVRKMLSKK